VATTIYELPFGKGRRLLNRTGLVNGIFGGGQIGAIWQMQSGERAVREARHRGWQWCRCQIA
jgi:hypothetical protein